MSRHDLSPAEWRLIAPLLPRDSSGPTRVDDRRVVSGIFYILRSREAWRRLPRRYGPHMTAYNRYARWSKAGVWGDVFRTLKAQSPDSLAAIHSTILEHQLNAHRPR